MSRVHPAGDSRNCIIAVCVLLLPIVARAENEAELLALVKAGHRSAQESIRSLSCTVKNEQTLPTAESMTLGRYWRSSDVARIGLDTPTGTDDYYFLDSESEVREVVRNRPGTGQPDWSTSRRSTFQLPHPADVWRWVFTSFDLELLHAKGPPRVKRERIDRRDCIRVTIDRASGTVCDFWFDVGRNYMIWKKRDVTGDSHNESEFADFVEPLPGVFFPAKSVGKGFRGGNLSVQSSIVFSDLRVNEPIPKSVLELPRIPRGTKCSDFIKKQTFPIDENWQQIPGTSSRSFEVLNIAAPTERQPEFTTQSTSEHSSWVRWIAPVSAGVLALAVGLWLYRRTRSRSQ